MQPNLSTLPGQLRERALRSTKLVLPHTGRLFRWAGHPLAALPAPTPWDRGGCLWGRLGQAAGTREATFCGPQPLAQMPEILSAPQFLKGTRKCGIQTVTSKSTELELPRCARPQVWANPQMSASSPSVVSLHSPPPRLFSLLPTPLSCPKAALHRLLRRRATKASSGCRDRRS